MKRNKASVRALILIMIFSFIVSACSSTGGSGSSNGGASKDPSPSAAAKSPSPSAAKDPKTLSANLTIWFNPGNEIIAEFNKVYPNIKVEVANVEKTTEKLITSLASGSGAPDIATFASDFRLLKMLNGLEDFSKPPYDGAELMKQFTETNRKMITSLDGKRLFGWPGYMSPFVMFYRKDIVEENGFPSEPEEFGKFIADEENFFKFAQTVRQKGHYLFRSTSELLDMVIGGMSYYDDNFKYLRDTDQVVKAIDIVKRAKQLDLIYDGKSEEQKQAVSTGKLMAYFKSPGDVTYIEGSVKEDSMGKWRMTTLPFGNNIARSVSVYVIPSQSKNKEAAWELLKFITTTPIAAKGLYQGGYVPSYKPLWTPPQDETAGTKKVLADQNIVRFQAAVMDKLQYPSGNPLDAASQDIWNDIMDEEVFPKNMDSRAAMALLKERIEKAMAPEIEKLKKEYGIK